MSFLNPDFLWCFLALIPVLALHFLKSKPTKRIISSNLIWRIVLSKLKPNSFLQKFQNSLFLLFQILVITFVVLAMARLSGTGGGGLNRIIILDVSASMQATDVHPSRFQAARERACDLCSGFSGRTAVYALGASIIPVISYVDDSTSALAALLKIDTQHSATPSNEKFMRMLRDLEGMSPDEIFVLTDTLNPNFPSNFMPQTAINIETFGKENGNVAVIDSEAVWNPATGEMSASLVILNDNSELVNATLNVEYGSVDGFPMTVSLSPRQRNNIQLPTIPTPKQIISLVAPNAKNCSPADDKWFLCDPGLKPKVFLDVYETSILWKLKQSMPMVDFVPFHLPMVATEAAAYMAKGSIPLEAKSIPTCGFLVGTKATQAGGILPWDTDHPLLKFTNWDAVPPDALKPGTLPGIPLIEAIEGTLVSEEVTFTKGIRVSHLWVGLDPDHPTLQGNIFLPVLLFNILEYLLKDNFPRMSYPVGHPGLISLWKGKGPEHAGFHAVPNRPGITVAVNLESPSEAFIAPASSKTPSATQNYGKKLKEQASSPWQALLGMAFILVLGEWYFFIRRN